MTNREVVLGFLNKIAPRVASNAEIVSHTGIKPHQQVFQITQSLMKKGHIKGRQSGKEWYFSTHGEQIVKPEQRQIKRPMPKQRSPKDATGTVYWVSCVSKKQTKPTEAKDLYISDLFSKARSYVENEGAPWFVLSAKYGLVPSNEIIKPYDLTLNKMGVADRRDWAKQVMEQFDAQESKPRRIVMLAGARYREFLEPSLISMGIEVVVPMEGLRIGEQLSWLSHQVQHG